MLTRKLACPSCETTLKVADSLPAGKMIRCPRCEAAFPVPGAKRRSPSREAVAARPRRPAPPPEEDEDLDEEVARRPVARKRRKKRKQAASNLSLIIGGAVLLVGIVAVLAVVLWPKDDKVAQVAENSKQPGLADGGSGTGPAPEAGPGRRARGRRAEAAEGGNDARPGLSRPGSETGSAPDARPGRGARGRQGGLAGGGDDARPGPSRQQPAGGESTQVAAGRAVFEDNGCARCHSLGGAARPGRNRGPDLSRVGADPSHTVDWLVEHITNPKTHKPDSTMPAFGRRIQPKDMRALAEYLASLK